MTNQFAQQLASPELSRREFLGASLLGAAAISTASGLALLCGSPAHADAPTYKVLRQADATYFGAVLPAVIVQADSPATRAAFLDSFDRMLTPASPHSLGAIQGVVDLVSSSFTRPLMTLSWGDWAEMSPREISTVLLGWRDSSLGLRRIAYHLSTTLVRTAWYMQPMAQGVSGYPGSPKKVVEPLAVGT